jgi:hypothetical protein
LAAAVLGDKFYWWIDPIGAIVLAIYTISNWSGTVWENAGLCTFSTETLGLANSTCTHLKSAILLIICCNRKGVSYKYIQNSLFLLMHWKWMSFNNEVFGNLSPFEVKVTRTNACSKICFC